MYTSLKPGTKVIYHAGGKSYEGVVIEHPATKEGWHPEWKDWPGMVLVRFANGDELWDRESELTVLA